MKFKRQNLFHLFYPLLLRCISLRYLYTTIMVKLWWEINLMCHAKIGISLWSLDPSKRSFHCIKENLLQFLDLLSYFKFYHKFSSYLYIQSLWRVRMGGGGGVRVFNPPLDPKSIFFFGGGVFREVTPPLGSWHACNVKPPPPWKKSCVCHCKALFNFFLHWLFICMQESCVQESIATYYNISCGDIIWPTALPICSLCS